MPPVFDVDKGMSTLVEIERATEALPLEQQESLSEWLSARLRIRHLNRGSGHSVLDIAPVSLGEAVHLLGQEDDLLDEMLEDRQ